LPTIQFLQFSHVYFSLEVIGADVLWGTCFNNMDSFIKSFDKSYESSCREFSTSFPCKSQHLHMVANCFPESEITSDLLFVWTHSLLYYILPQVLGLAFRLPPFITHFKQSTFHTLPWADTQRQLCLMDKHIQAASKVKCAQDAFDVRKPCLQEYMRRNERKGFRVVHMRRNERRALQTILC